MASLVISIDHITGSIRGYDAVSLEVSGNKHAAVAMVLRESRSAGVEALFIERARHGEDPWSGQMAFPGGMVEAHDSDARQAAERETAEEVGIDLTTARYIGRLSDQQGRHRGHQQGIVICGFVYVVHESVQTAGNYEVADVVWVPLQRFLEPRHYTQVEHPVEPDERFPGIQVSDKEHQVVWGLTRRFLASFFSAIQVVFEG